MVLMINICDSLSVYVKLVLISHFLLSCFQPSRSPLQHHTIVRKLALAPILSCVKAMLDLEWLGIPGIHGFVVQDDE